MEKHHDALWNYFKLKVVFYGKVLSIKEENVSAAEIRQTKKIINEIQQNITNYQTANKYYLELHKKE